MYALLLCVSAVLVSVQCRGCSNHCFCYRWKGLWRTDCVRRNLFNTFVGSSQETQVLDLSHNVISILHGNEFLDANLRQLLDLRLVYNRLYEIDKLAFNGLELLEKIDLSYNSLEHLPPNAFRYNPNLKILNMSHNFLSLSKDEAFLSTAPALQVLDIAHCLFRFIGVRSFLELKQLRALNVSHNRVSGIHQDAFQGMRNLRFMDLSRNDLPCNGRTGEMLRQLAERGAQIQPICQNRQKVAVVPATSDQANETNKEDAEKYRKEPGRRDNSTSMPQGNDRDFLRILEHFFKVVPSIYTFLCGVQLGIIFGGVSVCLCMRQRARNMVNDCQERTAPQASMQGDPDNLTFALIPLNTPPGTPPSPYRSRLQFPSTFSLSLT